MQTRPETRRNDDHLVLTASMAIVLLIFWFVPDSYGRPPQKQASGKKAEVPLDSEAIRETEQRPMICV